MSKVQRQYIADNAVNAAKLDENDNYDFSSGTVKVGSPADPAHAVPRSYVDNIAMGLKWKEPAQVRAQGNVNLAAPGATIDGQTMSVDDRVSCDQQSTTMQDGLYLWKGAAVPMVRTSDAQAGVDIAGIALLIEKGTDAEVPYTCSNDKGSGVIGTDDIVMTKFAGSLGSHALGGSAHTADTLANLNSKISDDDVPGLGQANAFTKKNTFTPDTATEAIEANGYDNAAGAGPAAVLANGGNGVGGAGGNGVVAQGGSSTTTTPGVGSEGTGGASLGANQAGGVGAKGTGGAGNGSGAGGIGGSFTAGPAGATGAGGSGIEATGSNGGATSGPGGVGGEFVGGDAVTSGEGGVGVEGQAGDGAGAGAGGAGASFVGGVGGATGLGGNGATLQGGNGGATSGAGGRGTYGIGGDGVNANANGGVGVEGLGGAPNGSGSGGAGVKGTGGGTNGTGARGVGASSGYGVVAEAGGVVKSALRVVPQAGASSPLEGDVEKVTSGRFQGYDGAAWRVFDEQRVQEMHKVTAGEVTAGYFTLAASALNAQSVAVILVGGIRQVNKQCVGATGVTPDFDVISPNLNRVHINNSGGASGLSGDIIADDVLIIDYVK